MWDCSESERDYSVSPLVGLPAGWSSLTRLGCASEMQAQYGSLSADSGESRSRGGSSMVTRISVALLIGLTLCAVAAVGVLTHRGMAAHSFSSEAQPVELCDELECMLNSGSKPPGVIPAEPRTLTPEELEQMKAALAAEQNLEAEVRHSFTNGVSSMRKSIHFGGTKIPGVCRLMMIERSLP